MKKIYTYLAMFVAAATMVACENAPEGNVTPDATGKPIEITIGDLSRVMLGEDGKTITWEVGDVLGLFHVIDGAVSPTGNNSKYTVTAVSDDGKTATITGNATWSGAEDATHEFYIYYSYRDADTGVTPDDLRKTLTSEQKYNTDLSVWENFGNYLFAYGKATSYTYGGNVVFDAIDPYFGMLRLNITNNTGEEITISEVNLANDTEFLVGTHSIDLTTPNAPIVYTQNQKKAIPLAVSNGTVAAEESIDVRFLMSAKDYSAVDFTVTVTSDKGVHPEVTFKGGNIGYGARAAKAIAIEAVPTSSYNVGDVVDNGVIFWMSDDKQTAKVVSGDAETGLNYTTDALKKTLFDATDANDGTKNIAAMKAYATKNSLDFAATFPAAAYCESLGEGWYMPAWEELKQLYASYTGAKDYNSVAATWDATATARAAFDATLKAAPINGVGLEEGAGTSYVICSSETSTGGGTRAIMMNQLKKTNTNLAKYASAGRAVRCIKVVSLTE